MRLLKTGMVRIGSSAGRTRDLLRRVVVILASLQVRAGRGVGRRGERQQGAEEHRESGPEHEQTKKCQEDDSTAAGDAAAARWDG
jgi:hypothetical protein